MSKYCGLLLLESKSSIVRIWILVGFVEARADGFGHHRLGGFGKRHEETDFRFLSFHSSNQILDHCHADIFAALH